jgi:hypothetical protein
MFLLCITIKEQIALAEDHSLATTIKKLPDVFSEIST